MNGSIVVGCHGKKYAWMDHLAPFKGLLGLLIKCDPSKTGELSSSGLQFELLNLSVNSWNVCHFSGAYCFHQISIGVCDSSKYSACLFVLMMALLKKVYTWEALMTLLCHGTISWYCRTV